MDCCHDPADFYVHRCHTDVSVPQVGVHALVIGTSEYGYKHRKTTLYDRFGNISGAAFGAAKFARFLGKEYRDPLDREVLTIRLLLSPTPDEKPELEKLEVVWREATYDRVREALEDWYDDCDRFVENIAVLYIAGHGITADKSLFTQVFLKADGDRPDPFRYSVNMGLIQEALEYNYSQTKVIISDCCRTYLDPENENGIFVKAPPGRKKKFANMHRKYDPLHITSGPVGAKTYALGGSEGTILSCVLEQLFQSAGQIVHHPAKYYEQYFAITQPVMTERIQPIFRGLRAAKKVPDGGPQLSGHTVNGGLHRPTPPPEFQVEFAVMDFGNTDQVNVAIVTLNGEQCGSGTVSRQQKLLLKLAAGEYLLKTPYRQAPFWVDRPIRFDVLSGRSEPL